MPGDEFENTCSGELPGRVPRRPFHRVIDGVPRCAWLDADIYRESLKFRPTKGDLMQSTYPKSGTYWVQYITQLILKDGEPVKTYNEFTSHTHALDYFDHVAAGYALRDEPNVFFITYESIKRDTRGAVVRLSLFLGERYFKALQEKEALLEKIVELSKPEYSRDVLVLDFQDKSDEWKDIFQRNKVSCSRGYRGDKTKFPMVRTAKIGGWKEFFTPYLLTRMEEKIREQGEKATFMELWKDIREEAVAMSSIAQ
ncbi:hypothetical protein HPB52_019628 [Rhipicephalus sanguineus]|uniref:Sulfotransferase domain-containing protein n=1 Tax=Rhipicephalus sanguineus TaxID=34632 RepID=A0A9D4PX78_RHISA|nr:hypothetical protein HPB52_019628 [Rhipicephalus sanguineus]